MSASVLVGYATRYGSTQEAADAIAVTLRTGGLEVDVQPMAKVRTLDGYRAIVLGAPLYIGSWHKDAPHFLTQHQAALAARPVAIFALGPLTTDEKELQGSRAQLDKELAKFSWLTPVDVAVFVGKYDPKKLNIPDKLIAALPASPLHNRPASDLRDWTAIRAWASSLVKKLLSDLPRL
jgi:menaquinone-dependent protoporphyrinogen oxidase